MTTSSDRPLITFLVFTYQHVRFIREALAGAFAQTYSPLEIIISDDCSTDGNWDVIREAVAAYKGPHQIVLNRNERNLGFAAHMNRCFEVSRGEIIVHAEGDDVSLPRRAERIYDAWEQSQRQATFIYSALRMTAEDGTPIVDERHLLPCSRASDLLQWCRDPGGMFGCCAAYHRSVADRFGPLVDGLVFWDRIGPFRGLLLGSVVFIPEVLMLYRRHSRSIVSSLYFRQEDDPVQDYPKRLIRERRHDLSVIEQMLADLAAIDHPQRAVCERICRQRLAASTFELAMEQPDFFGRLLAYGVALRQGVPWGQASRHFAKRAFTPVYHWWIRRNAERLCRPLG